MKKAIIIFLTINLGILSLLMAMVFLAEVSPIHPGGAFYSLQHTAEQTRLRLFASSSQQAEFGLSLLERRIADMVLADKPDRVAAAAQAVEQALEEAIRRNTAAPAAAQGIYYKRLDMLVDQAGLVLASLERYEQLPTFTSLHDKVTTLLDCRTTADYIAVLPAGKASVPRVESEIISFLGKRVDHGDFPLVGRHDQLDCMQCHPTGKYKDTPTECGACHTLPVAPDYVARFVPGAPYSEAFYPDHFSGECSDCHSADNWIPYQFDHDGVVECQSCHEDDAPKKVAIQEEYSLVLTAFRFVSNNRVYSAPDHYPGECISCHTDTQDWAQAAYEHSQESECASCHQPDVPVVHYPGTCTSCHADVEDWNIASMDHAALDDCLSCHTTEAPADHYAGQCSSCHFDSNWSVVVFDHSGLNDCRTCHGRPAAHYPGQCSNCHSVENWDKNSFAHNGMSECASCHSIPVNHFTESCSTCHNSQSWELTTFTHLDVSNCATCHSQQAPGDHYLLACANCHNQTAWTGVVYDHMETTGCSNCHPSPANHYLDVCENCHNTTVWTQYYFDHTAYTDCISCHATPPGHYTGQCSNCHVPVKWIMIDFDHTGYSVCSSCHTPEDGHWPGECSACHVTENWYEVTFNHTNYTNCKSCHIRPAGHPTGQCSKCHTTDTWEIPTATPAVNKAAVSEAFRTPSPPSQSEIIIPGAGTDVTPMPLPTITPPEKEIIPIQLPTPPPSIIH